MEQEENKPTITLTVEQLNLFNEEEKQIERILELEQIQHKLELAVKHQLFNVAAVYKTILEHNGTK